MSSQKPNDPIIVAVVGVTGSGKSTFIRRVTGNEDIVVGHDLNSSTSTVQSYPHSTLGRHFTLVDTPGFDDGDRTDEDIFDLLADWLRTSYAKGQRLSGLLYLHRITANREKGSDLRSLRVFKKLCGSENYDNVIIGLTWWQVPEEAVALARERQLIEDRTFCADMVQYGAKVRRIDHDKMQCTRILEEFIGNVAKALQAQKEMASGKSAFQTSAAAELAEYKAIRAIKDAEKLERDAQEAAYRLQREVIEQRISERKIEQGRRNQELMMQQMAQMSSLEATRSRMQDLSFTSSNRNFVNNDRRRRIRELEEALRIAKSTMQPPGYDPLGNSEALRILGRSRMHCKAIYDSIHRLGRLFNPPQESRAIMNPTVEAESMLCSAFCDRCMRQASVGGYYVCTRCVVQMSHALLGLSETNSYILICNQCREQGLGCLDPRHTLERRLPGANQFNDDINHLIAYCPLAQHISAAIRCKACKQMPGNLFLHCCECNDHDFNLCLDCYVFGKSCKKKKKHTLFLHSWCPPSEFRRLDRIVSGNR